MAGLSRTARRHSRREFLENAAFLGAAAGGISLAPANAAAPVPRLVHDHGNRVSFFAGEQPLFEFRYSKSRPKTYVHPLFAPDGSAITLDGPEDHVHHRGLMLAWSDVNGFDFWGEQNPAPHGQIIHQRFEGMTERPFPSVTSVNHWVAGGKTLVIERQTVAAPPPGENAVWLEWTSELAAHDEPVRLATGGHVYNGLGIRFIHAMDQGQVLNAKATTDMQSANGQEAAWCGYWGYSSDGGNYGAVIFDHPENPRHPTPYFVMNQPFGYLSAAPTFQRPFQLVQGRSLLLRYAVVAFAAKPEASEIGRLYASWTTGKIAQPIGSRRGAAR